MASIKLNMDSLKPKREWKRHKVEDGTSIYRILPPFGEKSNGFPYRKWSVIWGLNDPTTGRMKPLASTSATEKKCPVYEYLDLLKKKVENDKNALIAQLKSQGLADAQIEKKVKDQFAEISKFMGQLRPKTVYAYNAADKAGVVGILELKATAHTKLLELMSKYITDYNQDPTSLGSDQNDSGVWFKFSREGKGLSTKYDVEKNQEMQQINGQRAYLDDRSPLHANIVNDYENQAYDVHSIYTVKTYDELKDILLFNLKKFVEGDSNANIPANPYLAVPGFDDFSGVSAAAAAPTQGQSASTGSNASAVKSTVNLKLDAPESVVDDEDIDYDSIPTPTQTQSSPASQQVVKQAVSSNDDIMKMAENLLNDV
ncbi:MAG: hypothetical protein HC840_27680 [Leptolyngbyaceae cyanobacterium RM2_2_4]|nr:hypothetical protein [Leptolyngbyaceae cyanobacterium RM2_2_4]